MSLWGGGRPYSSSASSQHQQQQDDNQYLPHPSYGQASSSQQHPYQLAPIQTPGGSTFGGSGGAGAPSSSYLGSGPDGLTHSSSAGGAVILDMRARNERERLEAHIQHKPFNFVSGPPGSSVGSNSPGSVTLSRPRGINGQGRQATPPVSINLQTAEDSAGSSTNPPAAARGRQAGGASDFVKKLHKMLEEDAYKNIVAWGANGDSFVVKDMNEFTKTVLPQHFKHSNFASFVRQLNKYDFHKVKNNPNPGQEYEAGVTETIWEFKHPNFSTDMQHSLENIKRKITNNKKLDGPSSAAGAGAGSSSHASGSAGAMGNGLASNGSASEIQQQQADEVAYLQQQMQILAQNQSQTEHRIETFTAQYHSLMIDMLGQHRMIAASDAFMASLVQYAINLESRLRQYTHPSEAPMHPPSAEAQQIMATYSELSRARYDKITEVHRRAEAMGFIINGNHGGGPGSTNERSGPTGRKMDRSSASDETSAGASTPDFSRGVPLPYQTQPLQNAPQPSRSSAMLQLSHPPRHGKNHVSFAQPSPQSAGPSNSYYSQALRNQMAENAAAAPISAGGGSYANMGELQLGGMAQDANKSGPPDSSSYGMSGNSYFPAPDAPAPRQTYAMTPGAVMVTTTRNGSKQDREPSNASAVERSDRESLTPISAATAQNTQRNAELPIGGEDLAAFAAALKGGQPSSAIRSALTAQPLLVRRATYIPEWSVPPRVLLVEDDAVCRNLSSKFLQIFGCTIEVAKDGVEAVQKMQTGVYDICMMDVSMPNLDGVSATSLIRQFDAMTPIISMTGNSRPDEILTYFSNGMNDVLPKPFTKEGMLSMLEKHLLHLKQIHVNHGDNGVGGGGGYISGLGELATGEDGMNSAGGADNGNPFLELGISNEDYQAILNGTIPNVNLSPSHTYAAAPTPALSEQSGVANTVSEVTPASASVKGAGGDADGGPTSGKRAGSADEDDDGPYGKRLRVHEQNVR